LPAHERDVQALIVELRSRASVDRPILGDHGLLWRGQRWVALSPIEARLTEAFIARPGRVLSRARLEKTGWPGGSPNDRSVDARIKALRRRIAPVGLRIHTVRGQGYIAEIEPVPSD
jgi:DNA-binding response OmpR family regulator